MLTTFLAGRLFQWLEVFACWRGFWWGDFSSDWRNLDLYEWTSVRFMIGGQR